MKLRPGPYRDVADYTEITQMAEIKFRDDLRILKTLHKRPGVWLFVFVIAIFVVSQSMANANQAQAAENTWRHLENETPSPDRNLWVYWESGECARLVKFDEQLGFYTSQKLIAADWWLYSFGDNSPPVEYCTYGK